MNEPVPSPRSIGPAADGERSLRWNILYAVSGMGFYSACQFGVTILLAKFASPEIQGQYFYGLAAATPIILLCSLELRGVLVADVNNRYRYGAYRALRAVMLLLASFALIGVLFLAARRDPRPAFIAILAAVCAGKIVWFIGEIGWGVFQRRERLDHLAGATGLRGLALIIPYAVVVPLYALLAKRGVISESRLAEGTAVAAILSVFGWAAVLYFYDRTRLAQYPDRDLRWNWHEVRRLAVETLPMGLVAMIINLCDALPRMFIDAQPGGKAALGFFGALATLTLAGNLIVIQAGNAAANRLSLLYRDDRPRLYRLLGRLFALAAVIGLVSLVVALSVGRPLLALLYTREYAAYSREFSIIIAAQAVALFTSVFGIAVTQMRLFWLQVPAQILTLVITAAAAWILIPADPVAGGAWTAAARAGAQFVLYGGCIAYGLTRGAGFPPAAGR